MDQQPGRQTATGETSLNDWRRQIDALDTELLRLLNRRAAIACEIAIIKVASAIPAHDAKREALILERIATQNAGPFERESVTAIFRGIIHETRRLGTQRMQGLKPAKSEHPNGTTESRALIPAEAKPDGPRAKSQEPKASC